MNHIDRFLTSILGDMEDFERAYRASNKKTLEIKSILSNPQRKVVTVIFDNGDVEVIRCSKEDHFDVNIGVALAIAQHLYGTKNQFHKEVARKTKVVSVREATKEATKKGNKK